MKVYIDEIDRKVVDLDGNIPQMIRNASEDSKRAVKQEIQDNTLHIQAFKERLETLESSQKGIFLTF